MLRSTRRLIELVRAQTDLAYDDSDWSPLSDITLDIIARRLGAVLEDRPLPEGVQEIGVPGYFGAPRIAISNRIPTAMRRLARRHGLAHLLAGELEAEEGNAVRFMSSILDWTTLEERRADLFALADLVPDRAIDEVLMAGQRLRDLPSWIAREVRAFAPTWPRARLEDRVRLRVDLYYDRRE